VIEELSGRIQMHRQAETTELDITAVMEYGCYHKLTSYRSIGADCR
jgi:hypothetical protein